MLNAAKASCITFRLCSIAESPPIAAAYSRFHFCIRKSMSLLPEVSIACSRCMHRVPGVIAIAARVLWLPVALLGPVALLRPIALLGPVAL